MPIEADNIQVYHLDDILSVFPAPFEDQFMDRLGEEVTYGDAQYTLVKGSQVDRMLHDTWNEGEGAYGTDEEKREVWNELPSLFNPGVLVALRG